MGRGRAPRVAATSCDRCTPILHRGLGLVRPHRAVGDVDERDPHVAVDRHRRDGGDHREVAVAARHLLHRDARARRGVGEGDPRQDLIGLERGREVAGEEVGGVDRPGATGAASLERGVERERDRRELGGGIGVGEAAADRASCAGSRRGRCTGPRSRAGARADAISADRSTARWRVIAPIVVLPLTSIDDSSVTRLRSMSAVGRARRNESRGMRLCPPARTFASSPCSASAATASSSDSGAT